MSGEIMRKVIYDLLCEDGLQMDKMNDELLLEEDLGMDSLKRTKFICDIEERLGFEFRIVDLDPCNFQKIKDVCKLVEKYI